jgi:hypothetical protein
METYRYTLVVAFAGYKKEMDKLFQYNEGLPSRFPYTFTFEDYDDEQLLKILKGLMTKKKSKSGQTYRCSNNDDKFAKLAIARLGKLRGTRGFGNARAVNTLFNRVSYDTMPTSMHACTHMCTCTLYCRE